MAWWHFGKKSKQQKPTPIKLPASSEPYSPPLSPDSVPPTRSTQDAGNLHSLTSASVPGRQSTEKPQLEDPDELHPVERRESQDEDITALPGAPQHHEFDSGPHLRSIEQLRHSSSAAKRSKSTKSRGRDSQSGDYDPYPTIEPIAIPKQDSGGLFRRDSLRRLSRHGTAESVISLPKAASLQSGMTSISEHHRFDVGGLALFSARPKIRYSFQQAIVPPSRAESRRTNRPVSRLESRGGDDHSVIDDLADEYDAPTIRELMERDQRRTDRRHQLQKEKAQRRLEREERRQREAAGLPPITPGEEVSRALEGLGLQNMPAEPSSPTAVLQSSQKGKQIMRDDDATNPFDQANPFIDPEPEAESQLVAGTSGQPAVETTQAKIPTPLPLPSAPNPELAIPPPANAERSTAEVADTPPAQADQKSPESGKKRQGTLAALFRRSKRGSQDYESKTGVAQGSFSNTSRESMPRQQIPAHLREQPSLIGGSSDDVTRRTRSKFREDLPESPAAGPGYDPSQALPADAAARAREAEVPVLAASPGEGEEVSGGPLSTSVASIGSEASWLSGSKPPRKRESRGNVATPEAVQERPETSDSDEVWADAQPYNRSSLPTHKAHLIAPSTLQEETEPGRSSSSERVTSGDEESILPSPYDMGGEIPHVEEITHARHARQVSSGSAKLLDIPARPNSKKGPSTPTDLTASSPTGPKN